MQIIIPFPRIDHSINTYKELNSYLKQLELAVHHAQKSLEFSEKDGIELTEDCYINFSFPSLESSLMIDSKNEKEYSLEEREILENFINNYYDETQDISLSINLN